jgi:hypothetical protein
MSQPERPYLLLTKAIANVPNAACQKQKRETLCTLHYRKAHGCETAPAKSNEQNFSDQKHQSQTSGHDGSPCCETSCRQIIINLGVRWVRVTRTTVRQVNQENASS